MAAATPSSGSSETRPYHHGQLAEALLEAAIARARTGGPSAIGLRDITRDVGVTPRAAYRHYADRDALVLAVARVALAAVRDEIARRLALVPEPSGGDAAAPAIPDTDAPAAAAPDAAARNMAAPNEAARDSAATDADAERVRRAARRLRAVGEGYIAAALAEPGLFETALFGLDDMVETRSAPDEPPTAYEHLLGVIDALVRLGRIPQAASQVTAVTCWSTVHGFATLATQGPLRELDRDAARALGFGVVETVTRAITGVDEL